jgi:hypothetical protein
MLVNLGQVNVEPTDRAWRPSFAAGRSYHSPRGRSSALFRKVSGTDATALSF